MFDARIDEALVRVAVEDGAVTLSGKVGSALERELAKSDAHVTGVRSVDADGLEVAWWARDQMRRTTAWPEVSDEQIGDAVKAALLYDPRVLAFQPEVTVRDGSVTLRGTVDSTKARRAAAQDAANTLGVWNVVNLLKVRPAGQIDDDVLETRIGDAPRRDPFVERAGLRVEVADGTAHLYGAADSWFQRAQAEDVASRVLGVEEVRSHLVVAREGATVGYPCLYDWDPALCATSLSVAAGPPDWAVRGDSEDGLFWSRFVDATQVEVSVDDGVATLSGQVDSWPERNAASENALEGGAVKVVNRLEVAYGPAR